jgi:anti-sigma factor ChrR (cupin superfamily)
VKSAETLFVRFKPGLHFPRHQHTGLERVLVLEGSYEDSHGVQHLPGQLREWPSGTEHSFKVHTGEPCIFASVVFGRRFYAWPLRALSKLLGK